MKSLKTSDEKIFLSLLDALRCGLRHRLLLSGQLEVPSRYEGLVRRLTQSEMG